MATTTLDAARSLAGKLQELVADLPEDERAIVRGIARSVAPDVTDADTDVEGFAVMAGLITIDFGDFSISFVIDTPPASPQPGSGGENGMRGDHGVARRRR